MKHAELHDKSVHWHSAQLECLLGLTGRIADLGEVKALGDRRMWVGWRTTEDRM